MGRGSTPWPRGVSTITMRRLILTGCALVTILVASSSSAQELSKYRERANSDDAQTIDEAFFHANARALVISNIEPNKLRVGGREFRVKRNPAGEGCFVYDPRTRFDGVKRNLVWWVPRDGKAYPLNSPSKMVTPGLKWSREEGIDAPSTSAVIDYVFEGTPMSGPSERA